MLPGGPLSGYTLKFTQPTFNNDLFLPETLSARGNDVYAITPLRFTLESPLIRSS